MRVIDRERAVTSLFVFNLILKPRFMAFYLYEITVQAVMKLVSSPVLGICFIVVNVRNICLSDVFVCW